MKQMIVQYAQAHHQRSRKDVMELCRVNAPRAYRLSRSMVEEGKLGLQVTDQAQQFSLTRGQLGGFRLCFPQKAFNLVRASHDTRRS
jgi:hypothetical protein